MELLEEVKNLIKQKNFSELENFLLNLFTENKEIDSTLILTITDTLPKSRIDLKLTFLRLAKDYFYSLNRKEDLLKILKKLFELNPNEELRKETVNILKTIYQEEREIKFLEKAEIFYAPLNNFLNALNKLDNFLYNFSGGKIVYYENSPYQILAYDFLFDQVELKKIDEDKIVKLPINFVFNNFSLTKKEPKETKELPKKEKKLTTVKNKIVVADEAVEEIFYTYLKNIDEFVYLLKNKLDLLKARFKIYQIILRIADLLALKERKGYTTFLKKMLFKILEEEKISEEELRAVKERILSLSVLKPPEKEALKSLLERESRKVVYHTIKGIERAKEELKILNEKLKKNAEDLAKARSHGDLSENYEYKIAKEERNRLLNWIKSLSEELKIACPIDFSKIDGHSVMPGTKIKVKELNTGKEKEYILLGPFDVRFASHESKETIIAYNSPFGEKFINKKIGDIVEFNNESYQILKIEKAFKEEPQNKKEGLANNPL
jgi:transcription elongation GreA/GreB family factor